MECRIVQNCAEKCIKIRYFLHRFCTGLACGFSVSRSCGWRRCAIWGGGGVPVFYSMDEKAPVVGRGVSFYSRELSSIDTSSSG